MIFRLAAAMLAAGCAERSPRDPDASSVTDAGRDGGDAASPGCVGAVEVLVSYEDGAPASGAFALQAGRPPEEWATTDADGRATVQVRSVANSERWITAGQRGFYNVGTPMPDDACPAEVISLILEALPDADNTEFVNGEGGYFGHSATAEQCMHCHGTIGEDWNQSNHHDALSNKHTRDVFNGTALLAGEARCAEIGGRWEEGGVPGSEKSETELHCAGTRGVLPDLNPGCGHEGERPCDHPFADRTGLSSYGACGDCHGAAMPRAVPGAVDINFAVGLSYREGITCDFCHKIDDVIAGPLAGIDGAIRLRRPSEPREIAHLDLRPIMFGPYPDVLNPLMGGSYNPIFRDSALCSGCHEYAQPALAPEDAALVDASRWPDGIPVHTTYSEWQASPLSPGVRCQLCHMPVLHEPSSTFQEQGDLPASVALGWYRALGEVRRHHWPSVAALAPDVIETTLALVAFAGAVEATATLRNLGAGHALPTGDPMRQVFVLIEATLDDVPVPAVGGRAVPDVGGWRAKGTVGDDVDVVGRSIRFAGRTLDDVDASAVRFVRPTGEWDDYAGPGVGWLSGPERTPEEKGLPVHDVIGETAVDSLAGDTATLASDPPAVLPGDVVYLVGEDDQAGAAGWVYAKTLVDRDGERGVHHYRAVDVASDNRIPATGESSTRHRFPAAEAGSALRVTARVVYRRYAVPVARAYAWDVGDLEIGSAEAELP